MPLQWPGTTAAPQRIPILWPALAISNLASDLAVRCEARPPPAVQWATSDGPSMVRRHQSINIVVLVIGSKARTRPSALPLLFVSSVFCIAMFFLFRSLSHTEIYSNMLCNMHICIQICMVTKDWCHKYLCKQWSIMFSLVIIIDRNIAVQVLHFVSFGIRGIISTEG